MFPTFAALVGWFVLSVFAVLYATLKLLFSARRDDVRLYATILLGGAFGLFGAPYVWFWMLTKWP